MADCGEKKRSREAIATMLKIWGRRNRYDKRLIVSLNPCYSRCHPPSSHDGSTGIFCLLLKARYPNWHIVSMQQCACNPQIWLAGFQICFGAGASGGLAPLRQTVFNQWIKQAQIGQIRQSVIKLSSWLVSGMWLWAETKRTERVCFLMAYCCPLSKKDGHCSETRRKQAQ